MDGAPEEVVEQEVVQVGVLVEGLLDVAQETRSEIEQSIDVLS